MPNEQMVFPWQQMALWLREGIRMAHIINKLMVATRRAAEGVELPLLCSSGELKILRAIEQLVPNNSRAPITDILAYAESHHTYPALPAAELSRIWQICSDLGVTADHFISAREGLLPLIVNHAHDPAALASLILKGIWSDLGPALADPTLFQDGEQHPDG